MEKLIVSLGMVSIKELEDVGGRRAVRFVECFLSLRIDQAGQVSWRVRIYPNKEINNRHIRSANTQAGWYAFSCHAYTACFTETYGQTTLRNDEIKEIAKIW